MVSTRRMNRLSPKKETLDSRKLSIPQTFQYLLSATEGPEGLKPPLLKSLYYLLIYLSSNPRYCAKERAGLNALVMERGQNGSMVTIKDICRLSDILFKELSKRFKQLLSAVHGVSASSTLGQASFCPDTWAAAKELNLLLRCCCMLILNLLEFQQYILEKGRVLLLMLRKLSLLDLTGGSDQLLSCKCTYSEDDCTTFSTEEFVASLSFLEPSAMLEVFIDELLVHGQLREFFKVIDSVFFTSEMLFMCHYSHGDIGIVIELISAHFCLSISDDQAFEDFLNRLSWLHIKDFRASELSLASAISLLLNPIMLSAPEFMQAHMISLVSEATGIGIGFGNLKPDLKLMDCYLSAFERSVIFYTKYMYSVKTDSHAASDRGSFVKSSICGENFQPSFESHIQPVTRKKLNHLITKLDDSWHSHLRNMFFRTKSDLIASSITYIKENQHILDMSCRDEILSILNYIILRASGDVNDIALHTNGITSLQDICLLASLLKLMSSSLVQALWCLRHGGNLGCPKTLKNLSCCKEYDSIVGVISCFKEFTIRLPIQKSLCKMMKTHPARHKQSKLMFLHLLGTLSLSFVSGFDFLVNGCILTIMAVMNLFVLEEGNLDALRSLIDSRSESVSSVFSLANVQAAVDRKYSLAVASKFQEIKTLYLRSEDRREMESGKQKSIVLCHNRKGVVAVEEETCNGEIFLKSILQHDRGNSSDNIDDLADFIECKQGKNYSGWVKGRQKYRNWKCEKMAVLRWERKKRNWKFNKGKKT